MLDQSIEARYYCIMKVYSSDGKLKMILELVVSGPDDDGVFKVKSLKDQKKFETDLCIQKGKILPVLKDRNC